jgi:ABC-type branched-subunit amino acid transport system permease subunit
VSPTSATREDWTLAAIPTSRGPVRPPLPAATLLVTAVYAAAAVVALVLGGPAQRVAGLVVLAVTAARLAAIRAAARGAEPWS